MTSSQPGDRPTPRNLAQPPSARYTPVRPGGAGHPGAEPAGGEPSNGPSQGGSALSGPFLRAIAAAILGAGALVLVGAVLASTFGLLFVAGVMGAAIGLVLARAAVPGERDADRGVRPVTRRRVIQLAVAVALGAVVVADVGTWLYGRGEGGTLGLFDYLWTAFGPFVPGVAIVAAVTAAWGASAGPVQR